MIGCADHINVHLTNPGALAARDTFARVDLNPQQGHLIHERIECAERANPFAEGAIEQNAQHYHGNENDKFPSKELSQRRSNAGIGNGQRNGALEHTLRTDVLTKERVAHAHVVNHQDG